MLFKLVPGHGIRKSFTDVMTVFMEIPNARRAATRTAIIRPAATAVFHNSECLFIAKKGMQFLFHALSSLSIQAIIETL